MRSLIIVGIVAGILSGLPPVHASPGDILYVQREPAELRRAPDPETPLILRLERGSRVMEFERRGAWVRVAPFGAVGVEGWVRIDLVVPVDPARPAARLSLGAMPLGPGAAQRDEGRGGEARRVPLRLEVTGTPGLKFVGDCHEAGARAGSRRSTLEGHVPSRFAFRGPAISCQVRKQDFHGRLRVALRRNGDLIARAETAAAFNYVRVRSAGPWGPARGVRGSIRIPRSTIVPETAGQTVPPLLGTGPQPLTGVPRPLFPGGSVPPLRGRTVPPLRGRTVPPLRGRTVPPLTSP